MKRRPKIGAIEVDYDEFRAISAGRQRCVVVNGENFFEPGDFIEVKEKPLEGDDVRLPDTTIVQVTHMLNHPKAIDPDYTVYSVARVTDVAMRLLDAARP